MDHLAAGVFTQPGVIGILVLVALIAFAVWTAKRERTRNDRISSGLPTNAWSAPCLDPAAPGTKRMLVVSDEGIAIVSTKSLSRDSWPWDEVGSVVGKQVRSRMQSFPGIRLSFVNGHTRELLVYTRDGKVGYSEGAAEAKSRIAAHLPVETDL